MCVFFFQAEDGIRDAQESRGLGDVYKRQSQTFPKSVGYYFGNRFADCGLYRRYSATKRRFHPVSYTHLTLPTIYSV